ELGGKDALAAAADHLLPAPDDREEPLVVERAEVAGEHPAVAQRACGLLRIPPVGLHRELAAYGDLAAATARHGVTLRVDETDVHVEVWPPDRLRAPRDVAGVQHADRTTFGGAVEDDHLRAAEPRHDGAHLLRGHGGSAAAEQAHGRQIEL